MSSRRSGRSDRSSRVSHGKPSKSTNPPSTSTSKTSNTSGRRSSAYDANFEQHLIDNRVYPEGYEYHDDRQTPEPNNAEELRQRLAASRPSLSPSKFTDSDFRKFKRANNCTCACLTGSQKQTYYFSLIMVAPYEWMSQFSKSTPLSNLSNILISNTILYHHLN